jgi:hypothetical protein
LNRLTPWRFGLLRSFRIFPQGWYLPLYWRFFPWKNNGLKMGCFPHFTGIFCLHNTKYSCIFLRLAARVASVIKDFQILNMCTSKKNKHYFWKLVAWITNDHCWMTCFIQFVRLSFLYWLWRRVIPYTWFRLGAALRLWPVSRGCLLLRGTWSYLSIFRRSVLPYTRFCNCLFIMITFYTLLTSLFCIAKELKWVNENISP